MLPHVALRGGQCLLFLGICGHKLLLLWQLCPCLGILPHLIKTNPNTMKRSSVKPSSCICPMAGLPQTLRLHPLCTPLCADLVQLGAHLQKVMSVSTSGSLLICPQDPHERWEHLIHLEAVFLTYPQFRWMLNHYLLNKWMSWMVGGDAEICGFKYISSCLD